MSIAMSLGVRPAIGLTTAAIASSNGSFNRRGGNSAPMGPSACEGAGRVPTVPAPGGGADHVRIAGVYSPYVGLLTLLSMGRAWADTFWAPSDIADRGVPSISTSPSVIESSIVMGATHFEVPGSQPGPRMGVGRNCVLRNAIVDFNARIPLGWAGLNDKTFFQLNVLNAFDELWVSSLNSGNGTFQ